MNRCGANAEEIIILKKSMSPYFNIERGLYFKPHETPKSFLLSVEEKKKKVHHKLN